MVEQTQKVLNTRSTQKAKSTGNVREYLCVSEEHVRRKDFKKAVVCLSLVMISFKHACCAGACAMNEL